ncbi:uncharacterized protein whip [Drosophila bipectinata]|uniref:uncharacterized protein whip n=1 Tax=Drosophila bipectinata TaxID=42026 RepID=UPI001C890FF5|nr:uncharacterized protein LOC108131619 [Drosophila bipectinata]
MAASVLATICAERLTKLLVRYARAQPPVVRNHSQCAARVLNPLPKSEATMAYLKPLTTATQGKKLAAPAGESRFVGRWHQLGGINTGIGNRFQRGRKAALGSPSCLPILGSGSGTRRVRGSFPSNTDTSIGLGDWRDQRSTHYRPSLVSLFKNQSTQNAPRKPFGPNAPTFDGQKLYRDCY